MSEHIIDFELDSCFEETAPPRDVTVKGKDGRVLLTCKMVEPTWVEYQKLVQSRGDASDLDYLASVAALCIGAWSLDRPVSAESIMALHPAIYVALTDEAVATVTLKDSLAKNSEPLSPPNGSQQNNERAETLTPTGAASGFQGS